MPSPIIMDFAAGSSLTSLNSVAVVIGVSYGTMQLPFVPLEFHDVQRLTSYYNGDAHYASGIRFTNRFFYENQYVRAPAFQQRMFHGAARIREKPARGFVAGFSEGGAVDAAAGGIRSAIRGILRSAVQQGSRSLLVTGTILTWMRRILAAASLNVTQASQSIGSPLYGLNGNDMYNFDMAQFDSDRLNACLLQASIGTGVSASLNLLILGHFRSFFAGRSASDYSPGAVMGYLTDVWQHAFACTVIGDAAAGLIWPGAQIQIVCT